jgi:hypothetical protein
MAHWYIGPNSCSYGSVANRHGNDAESSQTISPSRSTTRLWLDEIDYSMNGSQFGVRTSLTAGNDWLRDRRDRTKAAVEIGENQRRLCLGMSFRDRR